MTTLIFFIGAAAVVAGCALIATPLAFIVGGLVTASGAVALERGSE